MAHLYHFAIFVKPKLIEFDIKWNKQINGKQARKIYEKDLKLESELRDAL